MLFCPEKGDGLVFQSPGQEMGLVVQKVVQKDGLLRLMTPERVRPGTKVYLTGSTALAKKAQEIIASAKTQIPLDLTLTWQEGTPLLQARLPKTAATVRSKPPLKWKRPKISPHPGSRSNRRCSERVERPLSSERYTMDYAGDLFAPLGALNQLRRDLLEKVQEALLEKRRPTKEKVERARDILKEMNLSASAAAPTSSVEPHTLTGRLCRQPGDGEGCRRGRMPAGLL